MTYKDAYEKLIWNFRLYYNPVGILFLTEESNLPVTHQTKNRLTYCQFLAAVRQARFALKMNPGDLLCPNAQPIFGFRELDKEADTKRYLKYLPDPDLAWQAVSERARLEPGSCKGIYMAPLDRFDEIGVKPSVVFILCVPYQAYQISVDYMAAMKRPNLTIFQTPASATCSGSVWSFKNKTLNMTTMCPGSKTSGKTEMNFLHVFIPGDQILATVEQLARRCEETGGPSLLGKGGQPWPGLEVCTGCPLVRFEKCED